MSKINQPTKRCVDCRQTKAAAEFFALAFTDTGRTDRCKACVFKRARRHRAERERRCRAAEVAAQQ